MRIIKTDKNMIKPEFHTAETTQETQQKPIFCGNCHYRDTWERIPMLDVKDRNGIVLWERWRCSICGNTTIYPKVFKVDRSV